MFPTAALLAKLLRLGSDTAALRRQVDRHSQSHRAHTRTPFVNYPRLPSIDGAIARMKQ